MESMQHDERLLRSALGRDPEGVADPLPDLERAIVKARSRRIRQGLGFALVGLALLTATVLPLALLSQVGGTSDSPVSGPTSDLVITNLEVVGPPQDGRQAVAFDMKWTGPEFPGVRECTWIALDETGAEVGSTTSIMYAYPPERRLTFRIPVLAPAVSATASCGPRLDVGTPYEYRFSNMEIVSSHTEDGVGTVRIAFDVEWMGPAQPGVVTCTFSLVDDHGEVIYSRSAPLVVAGYHNEGVEMEFTDAGLAGEAPASVSVSCSPYTGP
jgi:hypothetical protein